MLSKIWMQWAAAGVLVAAAVPALALTPTARPHKAAVPVKTVAHPAASNAGAPTVVTVKAAGGKKAVAHHPAKKPAVKPAAHAKKPGKAAHPAKKSPHTNATQKAKASR